VHGDAGVMVSVLVCSLRAAVASARVAVARAALTEVDRVTLVTTTTAAHQSYRVAPGVPDTCVACASEWVRCWQFLGAGGHLEYSTPAAASRRVDLPPIVTTRSDAHHIYRVASRVGDLSRARASDLVRCWHFLGAGGHLEYSTPAAASGRGDLPPIATTTSDAHRIYCVASRVNDHSRARASD
jgi:hypothetical protein